MRLTHFSDYGLRVLMYLASRDGDHVTSEEMAERFNVSWNHLLKVVRRLNELGYVEAKRGAQGGVRLLPASLDVTVGEVVRNLEPQRELVECFNEETNTCPLTEGCRLAPVLARASSAFLRELDEVRVRDLVGARGWPRPTVRGGRKSAPAISGNQRRRNRS
jgi:Rrf2 family transcriptional regulator, nitric oxide-sensitive transcriptional repressor